MPAIPLWATSIYGIAFPRLPPSWHLGLLGQRPCPNQPRKVPCTFSAGRYRSCIHACLCGTKPVTIIIFYFIFIVQMPFDMPHLLSHQVLRGVWLVFMGHNPLGHGGSGSCRQHGAKWQTEVMRAWAHGPDSAPPV